jgi:hypothetical protein
VSILIVSDDDGKFTSNEASSFSTTYAGMIASNSANTGFRPETSNGNITISRSDVMTTAELTEAIMGDANAAQTVKYLLSLPQ